MLSGTHRFAKLKSPIAKIFAMCQNFIPPELRVTTYVQYVHVVLFV